MSTVGGGVGGSEAGTNSTFAAVLVAFARVENRQEILVGYLPGTYSVPEI